MMCAFNPASPYVSGWLGLSLIVILTGFAITAFVFSLGRIFPTRTRERINGLTNVEITQLMLSLIILFIIFAFTSTAYSISCNVVQSISSPGAAISFTSPLQFASQYIGNLSMGKGLDLYTQVMGASYQMAILSAIYEEVPSLLCTFYNGIGSAVGHVSTLICNDNPLKSSPFLTVNFSWSADLAIIPNVLYFLYLEIFGPMIILGVSVLFMQYLAIPIIQYLAFGVMLPVAIIMRSIPFGGTGLRNTANLILALAVALYLIYPLTIAFDAWAIHQIFNSSTNPLYPFISDMASLNTGASNTFLKSVSPQTTGSLLGYTLPTITGVFNTWFSQGSLSSYIPLFDISQIVQQGVNFASEIAMYLFESVFLFGIDLALTLGFASSLSKALTSGVEGSQNFWANL